MIDECEAQVRKILKGCMVGVKEFDVSCIDIMESDSRLDDIGVNSIIFVKLVVEVESFFDIEFPLESLVLDDSMTIAGFCSIIQSSSLN